MSITPISFGATSSSPPLSGPPGPPPSTFDQMIENARIGDNKIYNEADLKNQFYDSGAPAPGLFSTITGLIGLAKVTYKLIGDFIQPTTESKRELLLQGTRDFHGILHGVSLILKYLIIFNISAIALTAVAPFILGTGIVFTFLEVVKDILELMKLTLATHHLKMPLHKELEMLSQAKDKRSALKAIGLLTVKIEKKLNLLEDQFGKTTIEKLRSDLATLNERVNHSTKDSLSTIVQLFSEQNATEYLNKLALYQFNLIKIKYDLLSSSQVTFLKSKASSLPLDKIEQAQATLKELIDKEHLKNAKDLSTVTSPGLAAIFFRQRETMETGLHAIDLKVRKDTTTCALKLFKRMEKITKVKRKAVLICMLSHAAMMTALVSTYLGGVLVPILATLACIGLSYAKSLYSEGYIRSVSGQYEGKQVAINDYKKIANWVYINVLRHEKPYYNEATRPFAEKVEVEFGFTRLQIPS